MKNTLFATFALCTLAFASCTSIPEEHLRTGQWKYSEGEWLGDFLFFDSVQFRHDTIFGKAREPYALITRKTRNFAAGNEKIEVRLLRSGNTGIYTHKRCSRLQSHRTI